ncbi:DUF748 domain-containing protein [Rhodanobacter lindaniclasticus]|uniref:DUF748 domain-containing protein n=1 Tax=Rhodanobacter lindaniclasticus TaxID=75310 RepID=A0A4S3KER7_9GAMM|nr:DUF748 domain-containing protein [Rhodanobacter lindaniclasticus]THD07042.1 hypothetical protein B1991_10330 [Rhodanobacter lindaniclasticus]
MNALRSMAGVRLAAARDKARQLYRSHRARKYALIAAIALVVFGLLGFLAAPPIIRGQIEKRASAALSRPVTLGAVHFNPYTLRLQLDRLHIADRDGRAPFVDIDEAVINASWTSLFRRAPVLDELRLQHPRIHIVRTAGGRFNFTDLLERYASKPADPKAPPARFSLSNIGVHAGDIRFDDQLAKTSHHVEQLELGIPFIANLPSDTDVFVQPLLSLRVDGSPLRIDGHTKPFADTREAVVHFQLDQLDLPRYLAYVPMPLPVAVPKGRFSGNLDLHFVQTRPTPQLQLTGQLQLDDFALASNRGEPILELGHGSAELVDVQPLLSRYRLGALQLDRAQLHYTQGTDGHSNFDSLTTSSTPAAAATDATPTDLRIASLALTNSAFHHTDATQHKLDLDDLHGTLQGLSLQPAPAGRIDLAARLGGGTLSAKGTLDLAVGRLAARLGIKQVDVAPLQGMTPPMAAQVTKGKLDADGQLQLDWGKAVNVHLTDAHATVSGFTLEEPLKEHGTPLAWGKLQVELRLLDLASRQVQLGTVTVSKLDLKLQRQRNGAISLLELLAPPAGRKTAAVAAEHDLPWRWSIAHFGLDDGALAFTDLAAGTSPVSLELKSLKGGIDQLSDKLSEARPFQLQGGIGRRGTFAATGKLRLSPLGADLKLDTRRLDIARFEPYIGVPLNVTISSAQLTSNGKLHYDGRGDTARLRYRGNAALERVRVQDKLTGDDFLRWHTLSAADVDAEIGEEPPRMHVGALALASFYARMIVNADGKLNLADVVASPEAAPVSVTRAAGTPIVPQPKPATPAPAPVPSTSAPVAAVATPAAPPPDIHIGGITLVNGQLNYTDNFIKPNYTANLTKLTGRIGAFGTTPGDPPAALSVQAALDDDSPVDIDGSINPLQPVAFLDIKGKANEVELTRLAAYSTRYTGYPITAGKLNVDVHYMLDNRKLNADNHIFITQLTFGARNESPGIKHLPVKLAVALLKDTQGNIDVNVPVSGSLDDPQFSLGGLIWRAIGNLIAKAATAPFRLLAGAFGGNHEELGYVEFASGSAVLDTEAQARLGKIVTLLQQKPSLKFGIIGRVDPSKDQDGLRKVTVDNLMRREKALDTEGKDADTSDAALAAVSVTPDEYGKYLRRAYRHDDLPDKPRNFLGLKKSLEPDEMRSLMETSVSVDTKAMRALAERRAAAVQAWLKGKLDDARVSLQEPKLDAQGIDDKGKTTRADFSLTQ